MDVGRWRGCSLIKLTMSVLPASVLDIADKRPGESCASVLDILSADFRPPKIKSENLIFVLLKFNKYIFTSDRSHDVLDRLRDPEACVSCPDFFWQVCVKKYKI